MTDSMELQPPRVRRGFRRLAIVAFVLLLPVAAHALWDHVEIRRLVREIEAIRAKGEPVTERQAGRGYRSLSPNEDLGARYYTAASALAHAVVSGHWGVLSPLAEYVSGHTPPNFDLAAIKQATAERAAAGEEALRLSDKAATLPFNGFSGGTSYSYRTSELIALLQLQAVRTAHLSLSGAGDAAVESARLSIRSRAILDDTSDWMRRTSFDVPYILSFAGASSEALRRLERELAEKDRPDLVERTVLADRAAFIDRMFAEFYGGDASAPGTYGTSWGWRQRQTWTQWVWRPWFTRRFVEALRGWSELVEASRLPWPDKGRRMSSVYARFSKPARPRLPFSSEQLAPRRASWWLPPADRFLYTMILPRTSTALTIDRAARTAIGLALFMADTGQFPESLRELEGRYLPELPLDPATGEPLRFKVSEGAFTVYSVGPDGKDDGGDLVSALRERDERGWGHRQLRGNDVGIRVVTQQEGKR